MKGKSSLLKLIKRENLAFHPVGYSCAFPCVYLLCIIIPCVRDCGSLGWDERPPVHDVYSTYYFALAVVLLFPVCFCLFVFMLA